MAGPSKRHRDIHDIDGEVEITSGSSSFRQDNPAHKRTKVALARARGGSVVSDDDDDERGDGYMDSFLEDDDDDDGQSGTEVADAHADPQHDASTGQESEADEIDELAATQMLGKLFKKKRNNIALDEGIIEEISCRNFMCHTKLTISLGPNINFIVGHNGSGKSAVLTALTMCLGGRAAATNRAPNLKSLIKNGQQEATLAVKIKNQGENAYKPNEYGRSITVERHFNQAGNSGFRLKNENGRSITTKRAHLDDMLDYFGLQLDNPINVLTQDMARQFLSNSSPVEKYKFFIRGTMLESLDGDYKVFEENLDSATEKHAIVAGDVGVLRQQHDDVIRKRDRLRQAQRLEERIRSLHHQHAWAQVEEQEQLLERYQDNVRQGQEIVEERENAALNVDARFEAAESAEQGAQRGVEQLQAQLEPAQEKVTGARTKFDENKANLARFMNDERELKGQSKNASNSIARLEQEIRQEERLLADAHGDLHVRRQQELAELKDALEQARKEQADHADELPGLQETLNTAKERLERAENAAREAKTAEQAAQGSLAQLQQAENRKYAPFPRGMEDLCRALDRETRWRSKPVGPFGLFMELTKPEWSSVLEKTIGGAANAFVVTCTDDANLFHEHAKRIKYTPLLYIASSESIDTTGNEPVEDVDTILRIIKTKNNLVRDQLIINQGVDQVVLIGESDKAYEFMFPSSGSKPRHVKATLCLVAGDPRVVGQRFQASGSSRKIDAIETYQGNPRMQTDRSEAIRVRTERLDHAKRALETCKQQQRQAQQEHKTAEEAVTRHKREQNRMTPRIQSADDAVEAKEIEIENNRPQDGKLQELQRQREEHKKAKESHQNALADLYERKASYDEAARALKVELETVQKELEAVEKRIAKAREKAQACDAERYRVLLEKNESHKEVEKAQADVRRMQAKVETQQTQVAEFIEGASSICQRVEVDAGFDIEATNRQLEVLNKEYQDHERRVGGTAEELAREFKETHDKWRHAEGQLKELKSICTQLKEALDVRRRRWVLFRKYISSRSRINFGYLLSERGFRGRVLLDHNNKKLDIAVEPDMARASDSGRGARTLSGGEKSFSTICLLLSIWEAMGSPIRCLDEFDVFMDSVNRAQSMKMMIEAARRSAGRQFVLITPQNMGNVDHAEDVRVFKMSDPERGQTVLSFGEA